VDPSYRVWHEVNIDLGFDGAVLLVPRLVHRCGAILVLCREGIRCLAPRPGVLVPPPRRCAGEGEAERSGAQQHRYRSSTTSAAAEAAASGRPGARGRGRLVARQLQPPECKLYTYEIVSRYMGDPRGIFAMHSSQLVQRRPRLGTACWRAAWVVAQRRRSSPLRSTQPTIQAGGPTRW
jgi:hypothetical protein